MLLFFILFCDFSTIQFVLMALELILNNPNSTYSWLWFWVHRAPPTIKNFVNSWLRTQHNPNSNYGSLWKYTDSNNRHGSHLWEWYDPNKWNVPNSVGTWLQFSTEECSSQMVLNFTNFPQNDTSSLMLYWLKRLLYKRQL